MKQDIDIQEFEWRKRKENFENEQNVFNQKIEDLKTGYLNKETESINEYYKLILNKSSYPFNFKKNIVIEYQYSTKILIVDYQLPKPNDIPNLKEISYNLSRNDGIEKKITEKQHNNLFDETIYKITLRSLNEIFKADFLNLVDAISFNGWVKSINRATGIKEGKCILSIQVNKSEFSLINLSNVEPKTCFKNLKGIGSSVLNRLISISPILSIFDSDRRFVASKNIPTNESTNLAVMNWEDFEHLIRELFEKEFNNDGSEVKVTQASRDGGVDAIAFDPDPIRGGKIVIQAKRYTNTVGVAAVRDLYGTVLNEGANKGILVTTSDFGPDSYHFAKGKPLTLLNGGNLLILLEKHGTPARINITEAKKIMNENNQY